MSLLEAEDWWTLLRAIEDGQCILLLGPALAIDPADPSGDPLPVKLAQKLSESLRHAGKGDQVIMASDLAHVAQTYEREMPRKRDGLEFAVAEFYRPYRGQTTPIHEHLAVLPFSLCISMTPDRFLLNAFDKVPGKHPIYDFYHFKPDPKRPKSAQPPPPEQNPEQRPLIYGLHGSVDRSESMVLTESDLLDFLVNVTRKAPPLHHYVASRLSEPRASFLFIGFGFRHWYMRVLLHVLKAHEPGRPSLALEGTDFFCHPESQETALFFGKGHLIGFHNVPWPDFAAELRNRFEADAATRPNLTAFNEELPSDAPVAFLCHEHRDKPLVELVAADLQARGIKVWLDKQNLRGGDNWTALIPRVIEKQTNYVVVLESPRMLDQPEKYYKREIYFALERQIDLAGFRFVIPVLLEELPKVELDPTHPIERLKQLHIIKLTEPGGVEALAQTIVEDWKKRQAMSPAS